MHFEYREFVSCLLARSEYSALAAGLNVSVENCPREIEAELTSDVAFVVADTIKRTSGEEVHPPEVCENLYRVSQQLEPELQSFFQLSIGGAGYLNASTTATFAAKYFEKLRQLGSGALFQNASFVVNSASDVDTSGPVAKFAYSLETLVHKRGRKQQEDIDRLLGLRGTLNELSADDRLMVLSLLADAELDVDSYLNKLCGRENIPWYLARYNEDCRELIKLLRKEAKGQKSTTKVATYNLPAKIEKHFAHLLSVRHSYFETITHHRPDNLLKLALEIIRSFYLFYNHPAARSVLVGSLTADRALELADLFAVNREVVEVIRSVIE